VEHWIFVDTCIWASFFTRATSREKHTLDQLLLGRKQASLGHDLPITDLVLAIVAARLNASIYTTDPHFDGIEGLKRFWPS
jgi:predicted nucleic acid-binding protein